MNILITIAGLLLATTVQASNAYYDLNLTKVQDMTNHRDFDFSLYTLCKNVECEGVKLTVPTGSKVTVSSIGNAVCALQRASSARFEGGDTYFVSVASELNSGAACEVVIKKGNKNFSTIRFVNERAGIGGGASISN